MLPSGRDLVLNLDFSAGDDCGNRGVGEDRSTVSVGFLVVLDLVLKV